jgi:hypothetical protein
VIDPRSRERPSAHEYLRRRDALGQEYRSYFEAKTRQLLAGQEAVLETTEGQARGPARAIPNRAPCSSVGSRHHTAPGTA